MRVSVLFFIRVQAQACSERDLSQTPAAGNLKIGYWDIAVEAWKPFVKVGLAINTFFFCCNHLTKLSIKYLQNSSLFGASGTEMEKIIKKHDAEHQPTTNNLLLIHRTFRIPI